MSGVYNQGPNNEQRDTTMRDLIAVLFKRKWYILTIFAVVTAVVVGRTMTQPVTYSADARMLLKRAGARSSVLERNSRVLPWVEVVESELEVIKSLPVMQGAVERLARPTDTHPDGIEMGVFGLSNRISAGVMNESSVLYVQGTAGDAATAVAVTNAVAESYVEYHQELFALPDVQVVFLSRADSVFAKLETAEIAKQKVLDAFGVTSVDDEEGELIRQRQGIKRELLTVDRNIARLIAELEDVEDFDVAKSTEVPFSFELGLGQGAVMTTTLHELRKARTKVEAYREKYTDQHPILQEAEGDLRRVVDEVQRSVHQLIGVRRHELKVARREADTLRESLAEIDARLGEVPALRRQLASLDTRIGSLREQYEKFSEYIADSQASEKSFQEYSVAILSRAMRAQQNAKGDLVRLALAPLLALMMGVFLAFYLENMDHSLGNREDVERHLDIPVLASFPETDMEDPASASAPESSSRVPFRRSRA